MDPTQARPPAENLPAAAANAAAPSARAARGRRGGPPHVFLIAVSLALLLVTGLLAAVAAAVYGGLSSLVTPASHNTAPPAGSFSVVRVVGTIQNATGNSLGVGEPSYMHAATLEHIRSCAESEDNTGILLYMNTGGGGVYESEEAYMALMDYKEKTGRPVWAYMAETCASGGYYICAAADYITANRNTLTGSIGVYIQLTDTSGLYGKLGIETVLVRSGDNKGTGMQGVPITEGQREVYQGVVDEYYARFVDVVAEGRGMGEDELLPLADGRVFTSTQAVAGGLIDGIGTWDEMLEDFAEESGGTAFYPNFSRKTPLGQFLSAVQAAMPRGDAEAMISYAESLPNGVPMAQLVGSYQ